MGAVPAGSPVYQEVRTFCRELPRMLAEGQEGKWALIKGNEIVGLFATLDDGYRVGRDRYLFAPFLVQPVREWQPLLRSTTCFRHAPPDVSAQQ
jgi:hypothetical protein